jgi:hypothetical protein
MPSTKVYQRGSESRFTISLTAEDRVKLDQLTTTYKEKLGVTVSHSVVLSLGLGCLHKELCGKTSK